MWQVTESYVAELESGRANRFFSIVSERCCYPQFKGEQSSKGQKDELFSQISLWEIRGPRLRVWSADDKLQGGVMGEEEEAAWQRAAAEMGSPE